MNEAGFAKAIRGCECLYQNARSNLLRQRRTFANSAVCQRAGSVPSFPQTSSLELNALLSRYRYKVFLPALLSEYDKGLVYSKDHFAALEAEPVKVKIGEEEFRLTHIDVRTEIPASGRGIAQVLDLLTDPKDWNILPAFLEGHVDAKRPPKKELFEKMIRRAGIAGRLDIIIQCVQQVRYTGFRLNQPSVVQRLFRAFSYTAQQSDWEEEATKQNLRLAENVAEMLEDERHAGGRYILPDDVRTDPAVIGILLQLAAVYAVRHASNDPDAQRKVSNYATKLAAVRSYPLSVEVKASNGADEEKVRKSTLREMNSYVKLGVPILHGMKTALGLIDPSSSIATKLKQRISVLEPQIERYVDELRSDKAGASGIKVYNSLLDSGVGQGT